MENNTGLSEGLTDAERAYFSSGGTDTAALEKEYGSSTATPDAKPAAAVDGGGGGASDAPALAPGADGDADEDGAITIGADGKARDTLSGKYVPHHALHKERERRKATDAELMTLREKYARGEERLSVLMDLVQGADGGAKPAPGAAAPGAAKPGDESDPFAEEAIDPEVDVFGALKQSQRQTAALLKRITDGDQATKAKEASASVGTAYRSDAIAFARTQADFGDAYNHLIANMHQELEALGVADEAARNRAIAEREKEFVTQILAAKGSPAAALYKMAKVRGYTPKTAEPAPTPTPAPAPKPAADPGAVAKLEAINKAKETVVSLGGSGGSAGGDTLTIEALANMSEAEFANTAKRIGKAGMARIMGG